MDMFYDPAKTFEENYTAGPYIDDDKDYRDDTVEPAYTFLGFPIQFPFGIAAGALPTSRHTAAAFRLGYDVNVYKTQRAGEFPCNPFPNVLPLAIDGDLTLEKLRQPLVVAPEYPSDLSKLNITNSFGVPSPDPSVWTVDMQQAQAGAGKGQLLIMAVMGTIRDGYGPEEYYDDFALSAALAKDAGAQVVEINLSCPNVASEGVICYNHDAVLEICRRSKAAIGDTPLVIKIGYFSPDQQTTLEKIVRDVSPYVAAISAINTLQGTIVNADGSQALPGGPGRAKSGVCGAGIRWAGLDMVQRLDSLRKRGGYTYEIIGVGGVMQPADFHAYRAAGADLVQAVTAPMWNPLLAQEVRRSVVSRVSLGMG
ncbi:diguanylate cyclase [Candidatus Saccharibacteria bacterium]|nr:diguanylate cyclase [Candidatus Saccharibacteria bacterium]